MVYNADQFVSRANNDARNDPGMCLQQTRMWAGINSRYPDATTAWKNATSRHKGDRHPPKGAFVYWTGGSHGYGHIACSVGGGKIRSTDAGGTGHVATVSLGWIEQHWGLPYAGWADNVNGVAVPGVGAGGSSNTEEDDVAAKDVWAEDIAKWAPDTTANEGKKIDAAAQLNQARGYAEDGYDRVKQLQTDVKKLNDKLDQVLKKLA